VRSLSTSEAVVFRSMLSAGAGSETTRMRRSGIPRRTYQEARQKLFSEGWAIERFVPNGPYFGLPYVTFVQARPFTERIDLEERSWVGDPRLTTLWRSSETLFGVFMSAKPFRPEGAFHQCFAMTVDARGPTVPVFFDFEGPWSGWTRLGGIASYPKPLPGTRLVPTAAALPSRASFQQGAVRELALLSAQGDNGPRVIRGGTRLPRRFQGLLREGKVEYRVFPNFSKVPSFGGREVRGFVLGHGELLPAQRPEGLFRALIRTSIFPFLFATDGRTVFAGWLDSDVAGDGTDETTTTFIDFLQGIELTRMGLDFLRIPVAFRYEQLFS
jgi:hypothetical protein